MDVSSIAPNVEDRYGHWWHVYRSRCLFNDGEATAIGVPLTPDVPSDEAMTAIDICSEWCENYYETKSKLSLFHETGEKV